MVQLVTLCKLYPPLSSKYQSDIKCSFHKLQMKARKYNNSDLTSLTGWGEDGLRLGGVGELGTTGEDGLRLGMLGESGVLGLLFLERKENNI